MTEMLRFMFAVGIECSCPTIEGPDGTTLRVDQLRDTGHYEMWKTDLKLVRELNLRYLRYGPPIYRIFTGRGEYRWAELDPVMAEWTGIPGQEMIQPEDCAEIVRALLRLSPYARVPVVVIERAGEGV